MMIRNITTILLFSQFSLPSLAAFVTWDLYDVTLSDGQTVTGSFDYDADFNIYQNIAISTSGSGSVSAMNIDRTLFSFSDGATLNDSAPFTGDIIFVFKLTEAMTNAGGTIDIRTVSGSGNAVNPFFECTQSDCRRAAANSTNGLIDISYTGGYIQAPVTTVPIPAAAWLFGSAITGLLVANRKNSQ